MRIAELTAEAIANALHASGLNCQLSVRGTEEWIDCPGPAFEGHVEDAECLLAALEGRDRPCASVRQ